LAYTAGVETQGGGTLHFHALITLDELPATAEEEEAWELKLADKDEVLGRGTFKQQYCNYADSLISAIYPVYDYFINHAHSAGAASGDTEEPEQLQEPMFYCPLCASGRVEPIEPFEHEPDEARGPIKPSY